MKIALIGATGFMGSQILNEAVMRGHQIVAITRSTNKITETKSVTAKSVDVNNTQALVAAIIGCDVVIHAFAPPRSESIEKRVAKQTSGTQSIINATKKANIKRLIAVGGAGTAEIAPGIALMDSYFFPSEYEGGARSTAVIKSLLQQENTFDWVFISPPNMLDHGERTGKYRTGTDNLIIDTRSGRSYMKIADYAVALIDEVEIPRHQNQRFTVGT